MKNLISPVLIVLAGLIVYLYMMPGYDHIGLLQDKKNEQEVVLQSIRNMGTRLAEIESEYQSYSPREQGLLIKLIPRTVLESEVIHELTAMVSDKQLVIEGVNFEEKIDDQSQVQVVSDDGTPVDHARPYREWNATILLTGNYDDFISLVTDLGRSIRITDVSHIIVKEEDGGGAALDTLSYTVVTTIYSLE